MTVTYRTAVRSFDHTQLAQLPAYHRLRQALNDLATESEKSTLAGFLAAVRDMVLTAPYADCCSRCRDNKAVDIADLKMEWPHAVHRDKRGWLTCTYLCSHCGSTWTCGYAASYPELRF